MTARSLRFAAALAACLLPPRLAAQDAAPALRVGAAELRISGRVQTQLTTTSVAGEPDAEWRLRRVRLEARVRVNDLVGGRVQPDFAGDRASIKDAYLSLTPAPGVELLAGRAHRPFSLLTQYSSLRMAPVEKGLDIRGIDGWDEQNLLVDLDYANRDLGLQLLLAPPAAPAGASLELALLEGPLAGQVTGATTQQAVARVGLRPAEHLSLLAAWSRRHFAPTDSVGNRPLAAGTAWLLGAGWDPPAGAFALAEATLGDFDPAADARFRAAHLWAGYRLPLEGRSVTLLEPILRYSHGAVTGAEVEDGSLLTAGLNAYFAPLSRVMLDYEAWVPRGGGDTVGSLKLMFQLGF